MWCVRGNFTHNSVEAGGAEDAEATEVVEVSVGLMVVVEELFFVPFFDNFLDNFFFVEVAEEEEEEEE